MHVYNVSYFLNDSVENFSKLRIIDLYNRTEHDAVIKGQIHQYDSTSEVFSVPFL